MGRPVPAWTEEARSPIAEMAATGRRSVATERDGVWTDRPDRLERRGRAVTLSCNRVGPGKRAEQSYRIR